jgi:sulfur carrier protein
VKIVINGVEKEVREGTTLKELLEELKILEKVMAVAVNTQIVKREEWERFQLKEGDKIEALQFVGGG